MAQPIISKVEQIAEEIGRQLSLEVVDVQFERVGARRILRVLIDKPGGIEIDDCERFSEPLSSALDEADPVPGHYYLEVSSPGLDRPLKKEHDFVRFAGSLAELRLNEPENGRRVIRGRLIGFENGHILMREGDQEWRLPHGNIKGARLVPEI